MLAATTWTEICLTRSAILTTITSFQSSRTIVGSLYPAQAKEDPNKNYSSIYRDCQALTAFTPCRCESGRSLFTMFTTFTWSPWRCGGKCKVVSYRIKQLTVQATSDSYLLKSSYAYSSLLRDAYHVEQTELTDPLEPRYKAVSPIALLVSRNNMIIPL